MTEVCRVRSEEKIHTLAKLFQTFDECFYKHEQNIFYKHLSVFLSSYRNSSISSSALSNSLKQRYLFYILLYLMISA